LFLNFEKMSSCSYKIVLTKNKCIRTIIKRHKNRLSLSFSAKTKEKEYNKQVKASSRLL